ncbi:MAG: hypothetical protein GXO85_12140 [Chlorobi bacterium]|nr:hypothetical protein [Chlorobiota bacterium]
MFCAELKTEYEALVSSLRKIAALNVISFITENRFSQIDIKGTRFKLSDDFPESYTTILSDDELNKLAEKGEFNKLIKEHSVIAMCSLFENYINRLVEITNLNSREASSYNHIKSDFGLPQGSDNGSIRKIYFIIKKLGFTQLPFEHVQPILLLGEMFAIRHVLVHFGGTIKKQNHREAIFEKHKIGNEISIPDNSIDDFIHRILIHMSGLTKRIDTHIEESYEKLA